MFVEVKQSGSLDGGPFRANGFAIIGTNVRITIDYIHRSLKKFPTPRC